MTIDLTADEITVIHEALTAHRGALGLSQAREVDQDRRAAFLTLVRASQTAQRKLTDGEQAKAKAITSYSIETGMCLWEAVQDLLHSESPLARALIDEGGTWEARAMVMSWIDECDTEWAARQEAGDDGNAFDWEHCPAFLMRKLQERFPQISAQPQED